MSTTKGEQEHGLIAQEHAVRRFLEDKEIALDGELRVYTEQASGRKEKRPRLEEMLHDAAMKKFRVLVVFKLDRLSRRELMVTGDVVEVVKKLTGYGVRVYSVAETWWDPDNPVAPLILAALSWAASMESRAIADRVTAGITASKAEAARDGKPFVWGRARTSALTLRCAACGKPAWRSDGEILHVDPREAEGCRIADPARGGDPVRRTGGDPNLPAKVLERRRRQPPLSWNGISRELGIPVGTARDYHRLALEAEREGGATASRPANSGS